VVYAHQYLHHTSLQSPLQPLWLHHL